MSTLPTVELGVLGPLQVRQDGTPVTIPGAKPRAILAMLGLHSGSVVSADTLIELLWDADPPRTADKALQTHISSLRRTLGDGIVLTEGAGWTLAGTEVDASRYTLTARLGRQAAAAGDTGQAVARLEEALTLWRGTPELPDGQRGTSEKTRWIERHAALVEDRADALLATGRAAEIIGELEAAVAEAPLRERRWGQLMLALYRAGRQGDALGAYKRARSLLADELGIDPGPELRRLEAAIVAQDSALDTPVAQHLSSVMRAVTFLLTDIEGSTAAWEADAGAMAVALARHDELVEQVVTSRGGRLIKTRGEGDATFSVFDRPSGAAAAALELQDAIKHEPFALREPMRIRVALHTGEVELRDGDYFGRAVNRAARLRSLAEGGQILCSGATAELVIDSLPDDVVLADLGKRQLRNLPRPEHVFELRVETAEDSSEPDTGIAPMQRPDLPAVLVGPGPFVGRRRELESLLSAWQTAVTGGARAVLIAGEPGVGKTRLAGEWSQQAYAQGAVVLYGRCDEDLGAPYQPFAEALRSLVPCLGADRLRGLRGVEALLPLAPGLTDVLPDIANPARADPDTERYALFDAVVALLGIASAGATVVLILDDLHWAAKPTLLLLRHLLRFGDHSRVQVIGTYRNTDLDRSHPLAAMLADLHRDATADRLNLTGLDADDVTAYVAEAGYDDEELAHALASVTGGNPFFLIEALRHVDESGGTWDQSTLPQGVREAVSRRLSRLPAETNKALAAAAVIGSRFALDLVEQVVGDDLIDAFDEASKAGIVIEEPGGNYRFNHALVRQSLLAELASVRRMRLHQRIATTLETQPGADDELLAELAYHYFECAWAGNAVKAVEYCRRAADQALTRLAYEGAADLYDRAWHALEEIDDELPDRDEQAVELLVARCEALLAAGDVASAVGAVAQLQQATVDSARLVAWATCFDGELSMLIHPERLDEVEVAVGAAASKLAELSDAAGEAKAHTVHAACLARLGRIADCEVALDDALTAARRAREHRRVNAVLAGAPLAALWGPNPVPRAGGRCLDVVRLLRITTDSPAVEATSTRCQAVLEAFRGRGEAARRMIDSARRAVTELGLRHARLEVEQFAGIVELVIDDPAAAEPHLRKAYNGFRRMGLDAETAALLGRACLALGRDGEADELCTKSERLAGHALKPSIAWRTLRARLLSRGNEHDEARRVAEAAVSLAERTDALVDHGDACLALATVLGAAGDAAGARAAAERAVGLYERKGAAALSEKVHALLDVRVVQTVASQPEALAIELDTECIRVGERVMAAFHRKDWDEFERLFAPNVSIESRRKIVGVTLPSVAARREIRRSVETGNTRIDHVMIAARGERLALSRLVSSTSDTSPGAPQDELLQLFAIDDNGQVTRQVWFDVEDLDAAIAELDAAYARLEEEHPQARRLENTVTRVFDRLYSDFAARDWNAISQAVDEDYSIDDRRRVVNTGVRHGRGPGIDELRAAADVGMAIKMLSIIAIRGERLALTHTRASGRDPETIQNDALNVVEIDADERITSVVVFDLDDIDTAFGDLDARYLTGEAAPYAHTWTATTENYAALSRHELPPMTPDAVTIDHRRAAAFAPGEFLQYLSTAFDQSRSTNIHPMAVHRLNELGTVITHTAHVTSLEGFDAEFQDVIVCTLAGNAINHFELFGEADLDSALARFEELQPSARRLENAAVRTAARFLAHYAVRDWKATADMLAEGFCNDDRRRVVGAGIRHGRDAQLEDMRAIADIGIDDVASTFIATRGGKLVLARLDFSNRRQAPETLVIRTLSIFEIDADERIVALTSFDLDDLDAAFAELEARYLAGEAIPHAHAWSVITASFAALNRREPLPTTPNFVSIDHRRAVAFAPGELTAFVRAGSDLDRDITHIEAVNRLTNFGAVVTFTTHGTSPEGFDAEWRALAVSTVDGEMVNRCEVFDETDLDAAIARFEELLPRADRLNNAASQLAERFLKHLAASDWDAMAQTLADDMSNDDRRPIVGAGVRHGPAAQIADMRAIADLGVNNVTSTFLAIRGERLVLMHLGFAERGQESGEVVTEALTIAETTADNRIIAIVSFEPDDIDGAIAELDSRYLAGEAAAHTDTWRVVSQSYVSISRQELPLTTPDCVLVDHRRASAYSGDLVEYVRAGWELGQHVSTYVETVHRLDDFGAVVTQFALGSSREGFEAEWRGVHVTHVVGDLIHRCEMFEPTDLDTALARFDELHPQTPRLENAATRAYARYRSSFAARDWDALTAVVADGIVTDDRRRMVGAGVRRGRRAEIEDLRTIADLGVNMTADFIATRGEHLALARVHYSGLGQQSQAFLVEVFGVLEVDADERIAARVGFDLDDLDAAFAELETRYLAGDAAAPARTWSVISNGYAAMNRHQLFPTTPNWVNVDHRRPAIIEEGGLNASLLSLWKLVPDLTFRVTAVHRLNDLGAVCSHVARGVSQDGVAAEWRGIEVMTIDGDLINRCEIFDEADLDGALARFDELQPRATRLENAAGRAYDRLLACFTAHEWDAVGEMLVADVVSDDRRRTANSGIRRGRDAAVQDARAMADVWITTVTSKVIAIRGEHLSLARARYSGRNQGAEAFYTEVLNLVEINDHGEIVARLWLDPDDIDAAFTELDARYLAGEAANHARTWSVIATAYAALNRAEVPTTASDFEDIDHRRGAMVAPGDLMAYLRTSLDEPGRNSLYVEAVHRLTARGAVITHVAKATSGDGFEAEWRMTCLFTVDGDLLNRCEMFDEADLDTALARLNELHPQTPRLENAAGQVVERFWTCLATRD
ncbi:BTAD domain-containing putative transcriptional regulator [Mycobacterium montefiorense]|uniref:BTAD domain-containing putative transcriptional regulator n=1 Tax=Mycobacterium montefiorense TaxID=154654 RepID=UPI003FD83B9B